MLCLRLSLLSPTGFAEWRSPGDLAVFPSWSMLQVLSLGHDAQGVRVSQSEL